MKKILSLLCSSLMLANLCACSENDHTTGDGDTTDSYDVTKAHVIINQFYAGVNNKGTASNCFAELYNTTSQPQVLDGWSLWYLGSKIDTLNTSGWHRLLLKGTIPAYSSFLIRGNRYTNDKKAHNIEIENPDQEWNIYFNTKGMALLLKSDTTVISNDSLIFNNTTHKPTIAHYVDMLAVHGNDNVADEFISVYESNATCSQSSKRAIRRQYFQDTDINEADTEDGDCISADYSSSDSAFMQWVRPRSAAEGPWFSSAMPEYTETTQLHPDSINTITTCITTTPYQSRSFTWQMPQNIVQGSVSISTSPSMGSPMVIAAVRSLNYKGNASVFRASTTQLTAGTTYYYQITSGSTTSPVYSFTTATEDASFTFLHTSDTQSTKAAGYVTCSHALRQIVDEYKPQFVIHTGDQVETNYFEDEWRWYINDEKSVLTRLPYFPTVGNHEETTVYPARAFREHFSVPDNSCTAAAVTPGTVYSFNWGKVHFVVLNTQCKSGFSAEAEWLRNDLSNYKNGNVIICMHRGEYDLNGIVTDVTTAFTDIFAEYGVSLVLYGHDHCYLRSIQNDNCKTVHLQTGSSGTKQAATSVTRPSYVDVMATPQLPTISVITVTSTEIKVRTVTVDEKEGIVPLDNNAHLSKSDDTKTVDFSIPIK